MKHINFSLFILILLLISNIEINAQENTMYKTPPKEIADLITAPFTPAVGISPQRDKLLILNRPSLPTIEDLSQPELGLGGNRINPLTNGPSSSIGYNNIKIKVLADFKEFPIMGIPQNSKIDNISWSPDFQKIAFTLTQANGIELWYASLTDFNAHKLTAPIINNFFGDNGYRWLNATTLIFKSIIPNRGNAPKENLVPDGPVIQQSNGDKTPLRTYTDLLKNKFDESLFEYYATSKLVSIDLTGKTGDWNKTGIISNLMVSPDGNYLLTQTIKRPYSYLVSTSQFAQSWELFNASGKMIKVVADIPLSESLPKGFDAVRKGPRSFSWRADKAAMLYWVEVQDGGDPKINMAVRDKLFYIDAPFDKIATESISLKYRYAGINWGNDDLAIVSERWWANRQIITSIFKPGKDTSKVMLWQRSSEDKYGDPGDFLSVINSFGRPILLSIDNFKTLYLSGQGSSPEGNKPFLDAFTLATKKSNRLWQSAAPYYEFMVGAIDLKKNLILTRRESNTEVPNYFLRDLKKQKFTAITQFENPYPALNGVTNQIVQYERKDGVKLSGKLYLPKDYKKENGTLPVLMWAYPEEFKSAAAAGQMDDSPYKFTIVNWASPLLWVMQGYAIFDHPSMPIIGEGTKEPNDAYVDQLVANAEAAINKLVDLGVADRKRIAVGGHSYGAFMTANLLAHSNLFAAGIARSGAYNRTLTPFGFQSEERTFWEATETYMKMSPFAYADKLKTPILLIHGGADNNPGTFTLQSERMFTALKGHGAIARLVILPKESHSYRAKESLLHMAWEMNEWLDKYVKNKK